MTDLTPVPVFNLYNPDDYLDWTERQTIDKLFGAFNYPVSHQTYVTVGDINRCEETLGIPHINVMQYDFSVPEIRQWYTFINVLRKARVYESFIITFPGKKTMNPLHEGMALHRFVRIDNNTYYLHRVEAQRIISEVLSHRRIRSSVKNYLKNLNVYFNREQSEARSKGISPARTNLRDIEIADMRMVNYKQT